MVVKTHFFYVVCRQLLLIWLVFCWLLHSTYSIQFLYVTGLSIVSTVLNTSGIGYLSFRSLVAASICTCSTSSFVFHLSLLFSTLGLSIFAVQLGHAAHIKKVLNLIPQDASVSTSGYIVSHLSGRRNIIGLEVMQMKDEEGKVVDVDYALLDLWQLQQNNLKVPVDRGRVPGGVRFTDEALRRGLYGIAEVLDGVVLVQKGIPSKPKVLSAWSKLPQEIEPLMK